MKKLCYTSACMERRRRGRYKTKQQKKVAQTIRIISREIPLTDTDRITYVYVKDKTTDVIQKVINVSYEAWIEKRWLTILRYDSTHGYLHQHARFSLTQEKEFISKEHILQAGSHQDWLPGQSRTLKQIFRPTDGHFSIEAILMMRQKRISFTDLLRSSYIHLSQDML